MSYVIPDNLRLHVYDIDQAAERLAITTDDLWAALSSGRIGLWPAILAPGIVVWSRLHFESWLRIGAPTTVGLASHMAAIQQLLDARPPVAPVDLADVDLTAAQ